MRRLAAGVAVAVLGAATYAGAASARDRNPGQAGLSLSVRVGPVSVSTSASVPSPPEEAAVSASVTSPPLSTSATAGPSGATVAATTAPASAAAAVDTGSDPGLRASLEVEPTVSASVDIRPVQRTVTVQVEASDTQIEARTPAPAPPQRPAAPRAPHPVAAAPLQATVPPASLGQAPAPTAVAAAPTSRRAAPAVERPALAAVDRPPTRRTAVAAPTRHPAIRLHPLVLRPVARLTHASAPVAPAPPPSAPPASAASPAATVVQTPAGLPRMLDPFGIGVGGSAAAFGFAAFVVAALVIGLVLAAPRLGRWPRPTAGSAPQPGFSSPLERPG